LKTFQGFDSVPGRRVPLPETTTVSDYFNIFIKDDDFEEIATETSRYAEQYFENNQNLETFSRFRKWQSTCASEIKRYILCQSNLSSCPGLDHMLPH
jgi:hypothetical protein